MDLSEFGHLVKDSLIYLDKQQEKCERGFGLKQLNRMDYEQETGKMIFSEVGVIPRVVADFQIVGSLSARSLTWLWAWDNPYLIESTCRAVMKVKKFGKENAISKLTEPKWKATEKDAWEMTAIAVWLLKAKGAYTFLSDDIQVFTVFTGIKWIGQKSEPDNSPTGDRINM